MTNLLATLVITLNTNWVNQTKTVPFCNLESCALQHVQMVKQLGTVITNWSAKFTFDGRELLVLLKAQEEKIPSQERTVAEAVELHHQFINRIVGGGDIQIQGGRFFLN